MTSPGLILRREVGEGRSRLPVLCPEGRGGSCSSPGTGASGPASPPTASLPPRDLGSKRKGAVGDTAWPASEGGGHVGCAAPATSVTLPTPGAPTEPPARPALSQDQVSVQRHIQKAPGKPRSPPGAEPGMTLITALCGLESLGTGTPSLKGGARRQWMNDPRQAHLPRRCSILLGVGRAVFVFSL